MSTEQIFYADVLRQKFVLFFFSIKTVVSAALCPTSTTGTVPRAFE